METYCQQLASDLLRHFDAVRDQCRPRSVAELDRASSLVRSRDAICWLFSPYL